MEKYVSDQEISFEAEERARVWIGDNEFATIIPTSLTTPDGKGISIEIGFTSLGFEIIAFEILPDGETGNGYTLHEGHPGDLWADASRTPERMPES